MVHLNNVHNFNSLQVIGVTVKAGKIKNGKKGAKPKRGKISKNFVTTNFTILSKTKNKQKRQRSLNSTRKEGVSFSNRKNKKKSIIKERREKKRHQLFNSQYICKM